MIGIRHEKPADYRLVEEITREAFWNLYCPGCNEHLIVHGLRDHEDFIPELTFVVELDGKVVGSIFYSRSKVVAPDGKETATITFGPVGILPELQRRGIGKALIAHSIEAARKLGHRAIIIGGDPQHYRIYGFSGAKKYGISMPDGRYYTGIMALPLHEGALDGIHGKVFFSEAFEPDEQILEDFDGTFPPKEKGVQESQAEFVRASAEIDTKDYAQTSE